MTQFYGANDIPRIGSDRGTWQRSTVTKSGGIRETIASVVNWFKNFLFHK